MTVQVGILYSDQVQVWKPVLEVESFRLDEVLTFSFTTERGNRSALKHRMWSRQNNDIVAARDKPWWGDDFYAIGIMPDGRYFTTQWPENDRLLYACSCIDGQAAGTIERDLGFPPQATVTIFKGGYLEPAEWEKALAVFETEMF